MRRLTVLAVGFAALFVHGALGQGKGSPKKGTIELPIPSYPLLCDVSAWNEAFQIVKTTYDKEENQVVLLLQARKDLNFTFDGERGVLATPVRFLDEDEVNMVTDLNIKFEPNPKSLKSGEKCRCFLQVPADDTLKKTKKVVVATKKFGT